MSQAYFTDAEVDEMTDGLSQPAAKIRYLQRLGLRVDRKPNGRPLAWRPEAHPTEGPNTTSAASIVVDIERWAAGRKARHGQKTQGR